MNEIEKMYDNCGLLETHGWSCKLDRIGEGIICGLEKEVLHCKNCKYSKQEYYHRMLDSIIDEPDTCISWDKNYNLDKYIKGLKLYTSLS